MKNLCLQTNFSVYCLVCIVLIATLLSQRTAPMFGHFKQHNNLSTAQDVWSLQAAQQFPVLTHHQLPSLSSTTTTFNKHYVSTTQSNPLPPLTRLLSGPPTYSPALSPSTPNPPATSLPISGHPKSVVFSLVPSLKSSFLFKSLFHFPFFFSLK